MKRMKVATVDNVAELLEYNSDNTRIILNVTLVDNSGRTDVEIDVQTYEPDSNIREVNGMSFVLFGDVLEKKIEEFKNMEDK